MIPVMPAAAVPRGPRKQRKGARQSRLPTATRIAAIDIGSNSIRQIVADVSDDGTISVGDEMKAAPRLGADVDATGVLGADAIERAVESIARMATLARQL